MSEATYISDLEKAEHLGYSEGKGVKRVTIFNNGAQVNVLTDELVSENIHTGEKELRVYQENHICTQNTTTTPLGANDTFTGEWQDCLNYQEVNVSIDTDQNSSLNGLVIQWSADGVNIGDTDSFSIYANSGTNYTPNPAFRYVRVVYTNGAIPQTRFNLMTILRRGATGGSFHRIDSTLKDDQDARLTLSVPKLKTAANTYVSQQATTAGNAKVSIEEFDEAISPIRTDIEGGGSVSVGTSAVEVTFTGTTKSIIITASQSNTGTLYIGKSNVTSAGANAMTFLVPGESLSIDYDDVSNALYVVADTAAQSFFKGATL